MRINLKKLAKNKKDTLVNKFTIIIGLSIVVTILFMSSYHVFTSTTLIKQNSFDRNANYQSIANIIFAETTKSIYEKEFTTLNRFVRNFIKNNLVLFVNVYDKNTNKYIWTSMNGNNASTGMDNNPWLDKSFIEKFNNLSQTNIRQIRKQVDKYEITVGFYDNNATITLVQLFLKGNLIFAVIFIIFGFISALLSARSVIKPIRELLKGTEEFSKGNLTYRAKITANDEIGQLAGAFNDMAKKLDILYSSLEQKVKDRTNELTVKNDQLELAYKELKETQAMLVHNEKMSSLGQLVAGIAHELNNPINFIYGNLDHFKNYATDLIEIIDTYEGVSAGLSGVNMESVNKLKEDVDYEFIKDDLSSLIKSCKEGAERCKQIIIDLKNFSRLDEALIKEVDIQEGIDSTLNILHNKYKEKIIVHKNYKEIPKLPCYAGQLNQVFMNILDNASQAIGEKGDVYINTDFNGNDIIIIIEDNGAGIDHENLLRIFDPFFTTKPVGEGTGLGLSISYKIIKKHNGNITVESEKGKGTKFTIQIPINWHENQDVNK